MENINKTINQVINAINWRDIKHIHKKLNILWEFDDNEKIINRLPTIPELKDELRSLIQYMNEESADYISHGNWVIFWDRDYEGDDFGGLRVIFRIADYEFTGAPAETKSRAEALKDALQDALDKEDYEQAAILRDMLKKKHKHK